MSTSNFRIGDRVRISHVMTPETRALTYTVVQVGRHSIDIEDINGNRHCVSPENIVLLYPRPRVPDEQQEGYVSIKDAVENKCRHTKRASDTCQWIAAAVIALHVFKDTSATAAAIAFAGLVLSVCQDLWQGIALEVFVRRLEREDCCIFDEYPDHINNGGWVFYILKIITILAAVAVMLVTE